MYRKPRMRTRGLALGAMVVALAMLAACGSDKSNGSGNGSSNEKIVVGAKNFPAAQLISDIYGGALAAKGFSVTYKDVGPTEQTYAALKKGSIDLYGEYQGTLLTYLNGSPTSDAAAVNSALVTKLKADKLDASGPSTAIDVNAFYVTQKTADKYHLTKISDLKPIADQLTFGGPPECADRPLCLGATEQALYDLHFKTVKKLDTGGPITNSSLEDGSIDVGLLFSGSSVLEKDFVQLQDDKGLQPADAVVAVWRQSVDNSDLRAAIDAVNAKLTTSEYNKLNAEINGSQKTDPKDAASQWLTDQGLS
jgi:osmoprotectant transport system substrate-binding protein